MSVSLSFTLPHAVPVSNFNDNAGTAILDVLIPPYDDASGRECTYYRAEHTGGAWVRLVPCNPGDQFRIMRGTLVSPYSYSK